MQQGRPVIDYATPAAKRRMSLTVVLALAAVIMLALMLTGLLFFAPRAVVTMNVATVNLAPVATTQSPLAPTSAPQLSEEQKIQRLIDAVEHARGITFIRNGEQHDSAAAAQHLRRKYQSAGKKQMTARQFIDELASRSSTSGEEYRIKLLDGREVSSQKWLSQQLEEIEANAPASQPAR
jgi:uncharacterized protein DUF5329